MNLQRLLSLVIVAAFIYFFTQIVDKLAKKRFEKKNVYDFTLRMNRGYAWLSTFMFFFAIIIFSLLLPQVEPHLGGYLLIAFIIVMLFVFMLGGQIRRLKVRGDDFCYVTRFGRSRKFTLEDITKAIYKSDLFKDDKGKKNAMIVLCSGTRWLFTANNHMLGFDLLLERLRQENVFERRLINFSSSLDEYIKVSKNSLGQLDTDTIKDEIESIREEMIELNRKHFIVKVAMFDEISLSELKATGITYAQDTDCNEIALLHYNDTFNQFSKDGMMLTTTHLTYRNIGENVDRIKAVDIEEVSLLKKNRFSSEFTIEPNGISKDNLIIHINDEVQLKAFLKMLNLMIKLLKLLNSQDAPAKLPSASTEKA